MSGERRFAHRGVVHRLVVWDCADPARCGDAPLVLVHGFAQSAESWEGIAPMLASGRTVIAWELAGHGASGRPAAEDAYALEAQAEALLAFLDCVRSDRARTTGRAEALSRPVVAGYSLGGRVALAAAVHDPAAFAARVSALVLESAGVGPASDGERAAAAERDACNAARLRVEGVSAFMDAWERLPLFATQRELPADVRTRLRSGRMANDAEALARTFERAGQHAMPDRAAVLTTLRALGRASVPVLYVAGGRDEKYRALAEELRVEGICAARVVEGSGHNVHLESPEGFARAVGGFLARCAERRSER